MHWPKYLRPDHRLLFSVLPVLRTLTHWKTDFTIEDNNNNKTTISYTRTVLAKWYERKNIVLLIQILTHLMLKALMYNFWRSH